MGSLFGILGMVFLGVSIIGWLWITVMAFSEGETLWGIGCLIISPVSLIYGIINFQELRVPVLMLVTGFLGRIGLAVLAISTG